MPTRRAGTPSLILVALTLLFGCSKKDAPTNGTGAPLPSARATSVDPTAPCPATFMAIPNQATVTHFACTCKPGAPNGPVYGKGPFSKDSAICAAGTFVSAVSLEQGGTIELTTGPVCTKYDGASAAVGGVTPQKKAKLEQGSFCVDRFGSCECT